MFSAPLPAESCTNERKTQISCYMGGGKGAGAWAWLQAWCFRLSAGDSLHFTMLESLCLFRDVIPSLITRVQSVKCAKEDGNVQINGGNRRLCDRERENNNNEKH